MISNPDLWARIEALDLDDPEAAFAFSARLARDNGWSPAFARRVVAEYKRFVYLSQVSDGIVTPSDEVDQAWHLHLTYTRHYWQALCGEVLGRPLHHGPTKGGPDEQEKYVDRYDATTALYRREFGCEPPADVWPATDVRFGEASAYRRVNTAHAWVITRPRWLDRLAARTRALVALIACALAVSVAGATMATAQVFDDGDEDSWIIAGVIVGFVLVMYLKITSDGSRRPRRRKRKNGSSAGGCGGCGHAGSDGDSGGGSGCGGGGCGGGGD